MRFKFFFRDTGIGSLVEKEEKQLQLFLASALGYDGYKVNEFFVVYWRI